MITLEDSLATLHDISLLEKNWDGYGSDPFSKKLVESVVDIVKELPVQPEIFPTGRGSIQIEYDSEDKSYFEAEIFIDHVSILEVPYHDYSKAETRTAQADDIIKEVTTFISKHKM